MINKGTVSKISSRKADISTVSGLYVSALNVPNRYLTTDPDEKLKVGDTVIFAYFPDGTGSVLERI